MGWRSQPTASVLSRPVLQTLLNPRWSPCFPLLLLLLLLLLFLLLLLSSPGSISAFLVDKSSPGVTFGAPERKMGWRSQPTASVHLDKVFVPHEAMLGHQGEGFKIAMHALDGGRINIAACR